MNEKSINEQYKSVISLLEQKRLKEAQMQLKSMLGETGNWPLCDRLEKDETSYRYMLQYMGQGMKDPQRQELYRQIYRDTWETADQARLCLLDKISGHRYHEVRRKLAASPDENRMQVLLDTLEGYADELSLCDLMPGDRKAKEAVLQRHENANRELFLTTWGNSSWSNTETSVADKTLLSETLTANDLCLFVSAVTLSLLQCFDASKFRWLLQASKHHDTGVNRRAIVGLALVLHTYPGRLALYPELGQALILHDEEYKLGGQLNQVYIQLLRSQETEKINKKMREEILPEMMKNINLMRGMKFGFEDNMEENDVNPDWEKAFDQSGLNEKIREINELQIEGSDVYMSTFSMLKGYPFFREVSNWFYPFDMNHPALFNEQGPDAANNSLPNILLSSGFFCNNDKYSLALMLAHMPQGQQGLMFSRLTSQDMEQLMEEKQSNELKQYAQRPEVISNQYIHDLYRFFKLYPYRHEFHDIFSDTIALHTIPALSKMLGKPELTQAVADFHFQKEHPAEALALYQKLTEAAPQADAAIYQKIGFCLQKEKKYAEAIKAYRKADVLKPDHIWTIRHLATCHRQLKDFATALDYYRKAETIQPENKHVLFNIGTCLAEDGQTEQALQYFFKLDLMEENSPKVWRAIAWCSFVCNRHEQSMKYYKKIMDTEPLAVDYLNAGHVAWVTGNIGQAAQYYTKCAETLGDNTVFRETFLKDKEELMRQGIDESDFPLMLDLAQ